jgi:hypothetical protein
MELNPRSSSSGGLAGAPPEVRASRMKESQGILDSLISELDGLRKGLVRATAHRQPIPMRFGDRAPDPARGQGQASAPAARAGGRAGQFDEQRSCSSVDHARLPPTSRAWRRCSDATSPELFPEERALPQRPSVGFHGGSHHRTTRTRFAATPSNHITSRRWPTSPG